MKKAPLLDISVPCKFTKPREQYKKNEIYFEAVENTQKLIKKFKPEVGNRFFWIYTLKNRVLALDENNQNHVKSEDIDWLSMIERNIFNILVPIFIGLSWQLDLLELAESNKIILGSQERNKLLENNQKQEELKTYYSAREAKKRIKSLEIK